MIGAGMRAGVVIVISISLSVSSGAATSSAPPTRWAVEAYLKGKYRFDREVDRQYAVLRHELWIESDRVSDYRIETLYRWVGAHRPAH